MREHCVSIVKVNRLVFFGEMVTVHSENHTKYDEYTRRAMPRLPLKLKQVVQTVITEL
jgi:hypothetical protein